MVAPTWLFISSPMRGTLLSLNFLYHDLSLAIKTGMQLIKPTFASIAQSA